MHILLLWILCYQIVCYLLVLYVQSNLETTIVCSRSKAFQLVEPDLLKSIILGWKITQQLRSFAVLTEAAHTLGDSQSPVASAPEDLTLSWFQGNLNTCVYTHKSEFF